MLVKFRAPLTPNLLMTLAQLRFILIPSSSSCAMWLLFVNSRNIKSDYHCPISFKFHLNTYK